MIEKCATSNRAINCLGLERTTYGIKSMDYSLYFYTTYCVNATYMYGIKSMDYSLNFLYHNISYKK